MVCEQVGVEARMGSTREGLGSDLYYRQSTSIFLSDISIVFPLETSILLERLPLERERYKKSGLHLYV